MEEPPAPRAENSPIPVHPWINFGRVASPCGVYLSMICDFLFTVPARPARPFIHSSTSHRDDQPQHDLTLNSHKFAVFHPVFYNFFGTRR